MWNLLYFPISSTLRKLTYVSYNYFYFSYTTATIKGWVQQTCKGKHYYIIIIEWWTLWHNLCTPDIIHTKCSQDPPCSCDFSSIILLKSKQSTNISLSFSYDLSSTPAYGLKLSQIVLYMIFPANSDICCHRKLERSADKRCLCYVIHGL